MRQDKESMILIRSLVIFRLNSFPTRHIALDVEITQCSYADFPFLHLSKCSFVWKTQRGWRHRNINLLTP